MENLLNKFLDAGLLPYLDSDERFKFVESTIEEIGKKLAKNRINLVRYTLTALHPNISEELSAIRETDEILKKHWRTIRVNIPDAPRQIWRAIIWESLNRQSKDVTSAAVIWLTASSLITHLTIDPNEREVLMEFLISLRDKVEKKANEEWEKPHQIASDSEQFNFTAEEVPVYTAVTDKFEKDLQKACGPNDATNTAIAGANAEWPTGNAVWAAAFAKLGAKAVGDRIDKSALQLRDSIVAELGKLAEETRQSFLQLDENLAGGITAERLRDDLLWWRQTLYSRTFKASYRDLEPAEAAVFIAFDLYKLLPAMHPISVEYLLREAFRAAHNERAQENIVLTEAINKILTSSTIGIIKNESDNYYKNFDEPLPLFAGITKSIGTGTSPKDLVESMGLKENTKIVLEDLSVWFFYELQAYRLVAKK